MAIKTPEGVIILNETNTAEPAVDVEATKEGIIWCCIPQPLPAAAESTSSSQQNPHTKRELCGATLLGALLGWLCCGGCCGSLLGASGAALAVSSPRKVGDVTRKGGEAVAKVGDHIEKLDRDHHVVEKTTDGVKDGLVWASKRLQPKDDKVWRSDRCWVS